MKQTDMAETFSYVTYYDQMPIPVDLNCTKIFDAGDLAIGVQFRRLTDAIVAGQTLAAARGGERGKVTGLDDVGVALHVFDNRGSELVECLRFDCFEGMPHYHYVNWRERRNEMVYIDAVAVGDPVAWSLNTMRTRLPYMIEFALGSEAVETMDYLAVDSVLTVVTESLYQVLAHSRGVGKDKLTGDK